MKIVLTGGGTAGHVTPNLALLPRLRAAGNEVHYIGTRNGMEAELVRREGIPFHGIRAGKLRRYLSIRNLTDIINIKIGYFQALGILMRIEPDVVFSKGGFVSCPVVWAAWTLRIPVFIHESDYTPGLANRLSIPFAKAVCVAFPETLPHIPQGKGVLTGIPIREALYEGDASTGRKICGFTNDKPVILVIGGSQGSGVINSAIRESLPVLLAEFQICHICGKGNIDAKLKEEGYRQFEYVSDELPDLFALADFVISRAGATTLFEILALKKPNLLIPLSQRASRGDQILNARSFERQGFSRVLQEEDLSEAALLQALRETYSARASYIEAMEKAQSVGAVDAVFDVIFGQSGKTTL